MTWNSRYFYFFFHIDRTDFLLSYKMLLLNSSTHKTIDFKLLFLLLWIENYVIIEAKSYLIFMIALCAFRRLKYMLVVALTMPTASQLSKMAYMVTASSQLKMWWDSLKERTWNILRNPNDSQLRDT